jgi:hypothetical protein
MEKQRRPVAVQVAAGRRDRMTLERKPRLVPADIDGRTIEIPEIEKDSQQENACQSRSYGHT